MKPQTRTTYAHRLDPVLRWLASHPDADPDLYRLADLACLSPYHFHRVYRAVMGETVNATVQRIRMHRAAVSRGSTGDSLRCLLYTSTRYRFPGRDALNGLFLSPLMIPHLVLGVALLRFFALLGTTGSFGWLVFSHVVVITPYVMRLVIGALVGFDRSVAVSYTHLAAPQPFQHVIDLVGRALHQGLDRAVQHVLHPALGAEQVRAPHRRMAVAHALHGAADGDVDGLDMGVLHWFSFG